VGRLPAHPISAACLRLPGSRCPGGSDVNHAAGRRAGHRRVLSSEQSAGGLASAFRDERASPAGVLERLARTTRRRLELLGGPSTGSCSGTNAVVSKICRRRAALTPEFGLKPDSSENRTHDLLRRLRNRSTVRTIKNYLQNRHLLRARCMVEWPRVRFRSGATQTHEPTAPTKRPANAGLFGSG
jgi:hypothetical protein